MSKQEQMREAANKLIEASRNGNDVFFMGWMMIIQFSDTSDFEEGEIRTIACDKSLMHFHEWDCIIPKNDPRKMDIGIDKDKNMYIYSGEGETQSWIKYQ